MRERHVLASVCVVEWALDGQSAKTVTALRHEVAAYLRRHADPDSDLAGAEIVVAELVSNALEHAPGPVWVRVTWSHGRARLEVHDVGPGFTLVPTLPSPASARGRGLFLANAFAEDLTRAPKDGGGSVVSATLPVRRARSAPQEPPQTAAAPLPAPHEVGADGTVGTEAFLRALVVELAEAAEAREGPDAVQALVGQVGANLGGRLEEAYRRAHGVTGALSSEQIADVCVHLKRALGGDFRVVDVDERKIVLGSRRCPFGPAIRAQPGLCRMATSVFGGIAARNTGEAAVALEERIALGDPECRIVVSLGEASRSTDGQRYVAPVAPDAPERALVEACRAAMHGEDFLYPEAVAAFLRDFLRRGEPFAEAREPLTPREREVVRLIADSYTGREIAERLVISEKTVERHRTNILVKLGLKDRVALTRYAIRHGLVEP